MSIYEGLERRDGMTLKEALLDEEELREVQEFLGKRSFSRITSMARRWLKSEEKKGQGSLTAIGVKKRSDHWIVLDKGLFWRAFRNHVLPAKKLPEEITHPLAFVFEAPDGAYPLTEIWERFGDLLVGKFRRAALYARLGRQGPPKGIIKLRGKWHLVVPDGLLTFAELEELPAGYHYIVQMEEFRTRYNDHLMWSIFVEAHTTKTPK